MDIGMSELLVIGIVALIVIGPKDLPEMFRQLGRFTAKLRAMSREFSRAMEKAADEAGVKDVARDLKAVTSPKAMGLNAVKDAVDKFEKWDPIKNAAKPTKPLVPVAMPATPALATATIPEAAAETEAAAAPAPSVPPAGPATQALYDRKSARAEILREANDRIKALDTSAPGKTQGKAGAGAPALPGEPTEAAAEPAVKPAPRPRAPRKKKAAEE